MVSDPLPPRDRGDFEIAVICALSLEAECVHDVLDKVWDDKKYGIALNDENAYTLGVIGAHNVVLVHMPGMGTDRAASAASTLKMSFPNVELALVVGICGGMPFGTKNEEILLGDVIISKALIQYDFGKQYPYGFKRRTDVCNTLGPPSEKILSLLAKLGIRQRMQEMQDNTTKFLEAIQQKSSKTRHPGIENDILYHSSYTHQHPSPIACDRCREGDKICEAALKMECEDLGCESVKRVTRTRPVDPSTTQPNIHFGIIGSANTLMKSGYHRDALARNEEIIAVETAGAGGWQRYAAATAAACTKAFLMEWTPENRSRTQEYSLGLNLFDAPEMGGGLFIGRQTEVQEMESILQPDSESLGSSRNVLVLGGMGGIGKTQLAISYAKRHRNSHSSTFWLNATSEASLQISLRHVAYRIFPPEMVRNLEDDQLRIRISNWMSEQENTRWLLIFDNYDDPGQYDITQYFPFVAHGSIIITTRQPDRINGKMMKIRSITEKEESLRILATRSGRENAMSDPDAWKLAERLDGHPLALATAGSFLSQSAVSFGKYLRQYEAKWKVVDSITALPDYPSRTLYSTWDISFAQIQQVNERAAHLLKFLAYLDHQCIWYDLLQAGQGAELPVWFTEIVSDEFIFNDAMQTLCRYCLAESHHQTGFYSLHVCVHDWTLDGLNHDIDSTRYKLVIDCITGCVSSVKWSDLALLQHRQLNAHAERLLHHRFGAALNAIAMSRKYCWKVGKIANLLSQQMQHKAAERYYQRALSGKETVLGPEHNSTLETVHNLGLLYDAQGKLALAEQYYKRALAGGETALGPEHSSTLQTVNNLGVLYNAQGKLALAEQYYQRALSGKETALGPEHSSTLQTVNNLGVLYVDQGKLALAEETYQRALSGKEKALGPEHSSTLQTVNNLGVLYVDQGKLAQAEETYQRALSGKEKALGPEHSSTLETVNNLGILYAGQGKLALAEENFLRALAGKEKALGPEHSLTLSSVNNLGNLYYTQGKLAVAEKYYLRALAGYEKALLSETIPALNTIHNLGLLYRHQVKIEEARAMFQRVLSGRQKVLGPDHSKTLQAASDLEKSRLDNGAEDN